MLGSCTSDIEVSVASSKGFWILRLEGTHHGFYLKPEFMVPVRFRCQLC